MASAGKLVTAAVGGLALLVLWLYALALAVDDGEGAAVRLAALAAFAAASAALLLAIRWTVAQDERDHPGSAEISPAEIGLTIGLFVLVVAVVGESAGTAEGVALLVAAALYGAWRGRLTARKAPAPEIAEDADLDEVLDRLEAVSGEAPVPLTSEVRVDRDVLDHLRGGLAAAGDHFTGRAEGARRDLDDLLAQARGIPLTNDVRLDRDSLLERLTALERELRG